MASTLIVDGVSYVECETIEPPIEAMDRNWRHTFHRSRIGVRDQLRAERAKGKPFPYDVDGRIWLASQLTDDELERVATVLARRQTEEAIRRHESQQIRQRVKQRSGQAL